MNCKCKDYGDLMISRLLCHTRNSIFIGHDVWVAAFHILLARI